ncbi:hypothetical protein [Candidatus Leptofilum sp.]|uniref:hypothetical protein n=1 Tax=Candidatus Leptofilum sp. TaxID=3241576 RepID=UPI003B5CF18B
MIYFAVCLLLGWWSGALQIIFSRPLITAVPSTPGYIPLTLACFVVILVGYGYIWPKGTLTHGRSLNVLAVLLFGLLWGISEGTLFVSVWLLTSNWISAQWLVVFVSFLILPAFIGLWHALYWDIYVAPEHNIAAWNGRKVLLAHVPNLSLTLIHLTLYQNARLFVLWQTVALLLSTYFMRFPPFWQEIGHEQN